MPAVPLPASRPSVAALAACLFFGLPHGAACGEEWAKDMFAVTSHHFGNMAKDSKAEYRFQFSNPSPEEVHVVGVRSSGGCASGRVTKQTVKPQETAEVVASFDTFAFQGEQNATLTVTFDKPDHAEVQLRVMGNIRGDVTFEPPFVDLGNVARGRGAERTVRITRVGSNRWTITDVRSANSNFEVVLSKPLRLPTLTVYDLTLRLKPGTPAGEVRGQLVLVTDDPLAGQIPMHVEGRVGAE